MARTWIVCLVAVVATSVITVAANARSQDLARSSEPPPGQAIGAEAQRIAESAPELKQAEELRDTRTRGTFVGTESGEGPSFMDSRQAAGTTRGTQRRRTPGARTRFPSQPRQTRRTRIRTTLTVGFAYTPNISPNIGQTVRTALRRIPHFAENSSIRVSFKKNVVVLEGSVANKHELLLAVQMAALEPGVIKVDNRLKIAGTASPTPAEGY